MIKRRVYEVAKDINRPAKEVLAAVEAVGIAGKTYASNLTPEEQEQVKAYLAQPAPEAPKASQPAPKQAKSGKQAKQGVIRRIIEQRFFRVAEVTAAAQTEELGVKEGLPLDHVLYHSWADAIQAFDTLQKVLPQSNRFEGKFATPWPFSARYSRRPSTGEYSWVVAYPAFSREAEQALGGLQPQPLDRLEQLEIMAQYLPPETVERDRQAYLASLQKSEKC